MKSLKAALWALNLALASASAWVLAPRDADPIGPLERPEPAAARRPPPPPPWDVLTSLRLPLGPRSAEVPPESLPRVAGVLTGAEPGSGVAFFEDPLAKKEFAAHRGETVGPWTVTSVEVHRVVLTGPQGVRELPVSLLSPVSSSLRVSAVSPPGGRGGPSISQ
jgi:hypothetical protein